ncbi:hypothetical protein L596_009808 [Steinernema carpocapsae]|uniref:Uncharacterized protein n=2 Tax=Steinernema carpocapsae TaxID=34508 RepID=A0A4U5PGY5_STECR|nr:hypothetical protein L596_009808 [Steinernema carpocapsae]
MTHIKAFLKKIVLKKWVLATAGIFTLIVSFCSFGLCMYSVERGLFYAVFNGILIFLVVLFAIGLFIHTALFFALGRGHKWTQGRIAIFVYMVYEAASVLLMLFLIIFASIAIPVRDIVSHDDADSGLTDYLDYGDTTTTSAHDYYKIIFHHLTIFIMRMTVLLRVTTVKW